MENQEHWRCRAVTVDPKNTNRIRIACRDEAEHQLVKKVAEAKIGAGARVLCNELYSIKVDSVNKAAVLDEKNMRPGPGPQQPSARKTKPPLPRSHGSTERRVQRPMGRWSFTSPKALMHGGSWLTDSFTPGENLE
jgi:hypothetical protein